MEFQETSFFTRAADQLLTGEELRALQNLLLERPDAGALIRNSGGVRVIYYHHDRREIILLVLIYAKGRQDNLSAEQTAQLRALIRKEFK